MENLLNDLEIGSRTEQIFSSFNQEIFDVNSKDFFYLLLQISQEFSVEIEEIEYYFTSETGAIDEIDLFDPELGKIRNLTWKMFKNRLKTILSKVLENAYNEEKAEKIMIENLTDEVFIAVAENIFASILDEVAATIEVKNEKIKEIDREKSWISQYLIDNKNELAAVFKKYSNDKMTIEGNCSKIILVTFMKMIKVPVEERDLFLFDRMVENRFKQNIFQSQVKYSRLTFNQFILLLEEWAVKEVISQISFYSNLKSTIQELKSLKLINKNSPTIPILKDLTNQLRSIQKSYISKPQNIQNSFIEPKLKALKELFNFYAKQIKMIGRKPTFDQIADHQSLLNISKFTKFCSDFGITDKDNNDHINVQQVAEAFLSGNDCSRTMTFTQFLEALDKIADIYYNEQYDLKHQSNYSNLKISEKRKLFYEFLQLDNRNDYMQRAKGFGLPFSKEKAGFRIPEYDLSKKYRFRDLSLQKEKIAEWRRTKNSVSTQVMTSRQPIPSPIRLAAVRNRLLTRKDRVTWDLLKDAQVSTLISKVDLSYLFTEADIREMMSSRGGYK